ncbi:alpha/beta hydrolase [Sphingobium nicotianae]|uniref:Esterase n=1 Tax=Sphingobium nicotianae TaxID=2782607 RepID=A0A9X1DEM6_9SPHN|nr:alpha/beta hydrolase [Sphingobium nicotianae]MBT2188792.1 esterase [Sphingobium nicotianae]
MRRIRDSIRILLALSCGSPVCAQSGAEAPAVVANGPKLRIEKIKIYSREIAGNLLGTPADRDVTVILPPSYDKQPGRLYPVVYGLHGFSNTGQGWVEKFHIVDAAQAAFARGTPEMILVFPSADNAFGGAFFTNSPTTGNFENFIADELVAYIDSHYRSIPRPEGRGLMGHSMGGYGTARIGMQRPGRFGALYLMSPCCLAPLGTQGLTKKEVATIAAMKSPSDAAGAAFPIQGPLATAAAWSPNPAKPPLYVDLAVDENGTPRPDVMAARTANAPLAFIDQYISELRSYRAIGIDVGDKDTIVPTATRMHEVLDSYHINNNFEIYEGTHTSKVQSRFQDVVLPFFGHVFSEYIVK